MKIRALLAGLLASFSLMIALNTGASLASQAGDRSAPSSPKALRAWVTEPDDYVYLKWDASVDDVGVAVYRLHRNSELVATTLKTYFLDMEYERELDNSYFVTALDAAGNESAPSDVIQSPANVGSGGW